MKIYKPTRIVYKARHYYKDGNYIQFEANSLEEARRFALERWSDFEILTFEEINYVNQIEKRIYKNKELEGCNL